MKMKNEPQRSADLNPSNLPRARADFKRSYVISVAETEAIIEAAEADQNKLNDVWAELERQIVKSTGDGQ
jgi:hypothetical protein